MAAVKQLVNGILLFALISPAGSAMPPSTGRISIRRLSNFALTSPQRATPTLLSIM
jgi:hypothetical protein